MSSVMKHVYVSAIQKNSSVFIRMLMLAGLFVAASIPLSSLYLHLPASFEALGMKSTQNKALQNQKCHRRDHLSCIYRSKPDKKESKQYSPPHPLPSDQTRNSLQVPKLPKLPLLKC